MFPVPNLPATRFALALGASLLATSAFAAPPVTVFPLQGPAPAYFNGAAMTDIDGTLFALSGPSFRSYSIATGMAASAPSTFQSYDGSSNLVSVNGLLYGILYPPGPCGCASIFSADPASLAQTTVYSFTGAVSPQVPQPGLAALNGLIYGVADTGAVFSFDPATDTVQTVPIQTGGTATSLLTWNGILYAALTEGGENAVIVAIDPAAGTQNVIASPYARMSSLVQANGTIYGVCAGSPCGIAPGQGGIFAFNAGTGTFSILHSFKAKSDGSLPYNLVAGSSEIFGQTQQGAYAKGRFGPGGIFAIGLTDASLKTLYAPDDAAVTYVTTLTAFDSGQLYGANSGFRPGLGGSLGQGSVFSINPANGGIATAFSFTGLGGAYTPAGIPAGFGGLSSDGTNLYVATLNQGSSGFGATFTLNPATGTVTAPHDFQGAPDGAAPSSGPVSVKGLFYGVTALGGPGNMAVLYSADPATGAVKILHGFSGGDDGGYPVGKLAVFKGRIFGTTSQGGTHDLGTAWVFNPATGRMTTLHAFAGGATDASYPASLIVAGQHLYGNTAATPGLFFTIDPAAGTEQIIQPPASCGPSGGRPGLAVLKLTLYSSCVLRNGKAALVSLDTSTNVSTAIQIAGPGFSPGALVALTGLYGRIYAVDDGHLFSVEPATGDATLIDTMTGSDGEVPADLAASNAMLYVLTVQGGANGAGTIAGYKP